MSASPASDGGSPASRALAVLLSGVGMLALATAAFIFFTGEAPGGLSIDDFGFPGRSSQDPTPDVSANPDAPLVRSLEELRERYGDPPDALYGRIRIPALGVDAPLG